MATFAFWASMPFVLIAALYFVIGRLSTQQQDWIIAHARYRGR
jgi:hypothetical protein